MVQSSHCVTLCVMLDMINIPFGMYCVNMEDRWLANHWLVDVSSLSRPLQSVPECKRSDCSRCDLSVIVKSLQSARTKGRSMR